MNPSSSHCDEITGPALVLRRRTPSQLVYAPNYWQWFAHQRNHNRLPAELRSCGSQLEVIRHLGLAVFSRNVYCDQSRRWFGGLADEVWNDSVRVTDGESVDGADRLFTRTVETSRGALTERRRYVHAESTLVQEKFLVDDYAAQLDALAEVLAARRWCFNTERWRAAQAEAGDAGLVVAGELHSPLKMLHLLLNPVETTYLLADYPERADELLRIHEAAQLDLVRQMAAAGVPAMMSMDNLDTMFHPPHFLDRHCARYYEQASRICHEHGSTFFIHACGQQRENLARVAGLGVDGLEGVAFPPLGDVELDEAMRLTGDRFIITGGISALEFERLKTRDAVSAYVRELCLRMKPYAHRFMLSASCNTPVTASWEQIVWFRDAWLEYGDAGSEPLDP
ncbi:MAG: uroporphyrinogen decarboxylase family protein [bacterium]